MRPSQVDLSQAWRENSGSRNLEQEREMDSACSWGREVCVCVCGGGGGGGGGGGEVKGERRRRKGEEEGCSYYLHSSLV